jgi:hypothetical protein
MSRRIIELSAGCLALLLGALALLPAHGATRAEAAPAPRAEESISDVVFRRLQEDGVSRELVRELRRDGGTFGKCELCQGVRRAFDRYLALGSQPAGPGLPPALERRLREHAREGRHLALREELFGHLLRPRRAAPADLLVSQGRFCTPVQRLAPGPAPVDCAGGRTTPPPFCVHDQEQARLAPGEGRLCLPGQRLAAGAERFCIRR